MLRIRLRKPGRLVKGRYHFKIIVTERPKARESQFSDEIGYYDPRRKLLKFETARYESWVKKGARPTETVASLFKRYKKQEARSKK
ncbi:MAG: 30S ribosomal protein S16 [Candidatus Omnitrophota bacterium]|nr:MAG: 30S ribosomal protein S16 [Candidatus Omnitrophota bacterium]